MVHLTTALDAASGVPLYEQLYRYIESSLDERERQIVTLRYGLFGQPQLPQREVAKRLGISRSYVSRIEKKALKLLKDRFDKQ